MKKNQEQGMILLTVLITITFIMMIGVATLELVSSNLQIARKQRYLVNAQFAADAGLDDAIHQLNGNSSWTGTGSETTLYTASDFKTTYQTTVTNGSNQFQKFIDVVAKTYAPVTNTTPVYTRKYDVEMRGVGGGSYSVVTGVGGLVMSNSSKILGGQVYVNGTLAMYNTAQIGLTNLPVNVNVADQACPIPTDSTYPRVCNSGEGAQPITINGPSPKIYGQVEGTNQTVGTNMYNPGLVSGNPAPAPLPTHDRAGLKSAITKIVSGSSVSCNKGNFTLAADTEITGDVTISGSCVITVQGDIWITGNLNLTQSGTLIVANGVTTAPVIMVDGTTGVTASNSSAFASNTNSTPIGFRVITYASAASCSPDCTSVTGSDLYNSRNLVTINIQQTSTGPQTEFFARWSEVSLANAGNIGALAGQTVSMSNSAAITFGSTVAGFSGPTAWVVKSYKRTF